MPSISVPAVSLLAIFHPLQTKKKVIINSTSKIVKACKQEDRKGVSHIYHNKTSVNLVDVNKLFNQIHHEIRLWVQESKLLPKQYKVQMDQLLIIFNQLSKFNSSQLWPIVKRYTNFP